MKAGDDPKAYVLSADELRKLQLLLLDVLVEIDRICKKYGIKYMLDGGTLLGAVRHGGFIPWDDDLDIVMLRSEYEKLREACKAELNPKRYFFQDHSTDPNYPWGYGRIRVVDSEFIRLGQEHLKMKTGIFLDIFIRDNAPIGNIQQAIFSLYCFALRKILYSCVGKISEKNTVKRIGYKVINVIPHEFVFACIKNLADRMNSKKTGFVRNYTFSVVSHKKGVYAYPREWFSEIYEDPSIYFEGYIFPISRFYKNYLEFVYGNYMELPPREKRRGHPCSKFKLPANL